MILLGKRWILISLKAPYFQQNGELVMEFGIGHYLGLFLSCLVLSVFLARHRLRS